MKINLLRTFTILVVLFSMTIVQSCRKSPCEVANCNGACVNGTCICEDGYTGPDCSIPPDLCLNLNCNNGACLLGACICDDGYDGTDCSIIIRNSFIGIYDVAEVCTNNPTVTVNYVSEISASAQGAEYITINNIYNLGELPDIEPDDATVLASVSNTGEEYAVVIDMQTFSSSVLSIYQVSGSGTYDATTDEITVNYSITNTTLPATDPNYMDSCTQIYTPQ